MNFQDGATSLEHRNPFHRFSIFQSLSVLVCVLCLYLLFVCQALPDTKLSTKYPARSANVWVPPIPYEKYKLANGLEVILSEDHRLPQIAVYVLYHVGPANERPGRTGFAHLFEHLMFDGSLHVGEKAHFKTLEAAGAQHVNGTTDLDHTKYFETVPSNELEKALWLESDRMGFLLEGLDNAKLANQRDVVRNERRQKIENEPYGLADEGLYHLLFPQQHPYHADVIGSHADIEAARIEDVRDFFNLYYSPNNASLAIVGDLEKGRTKQLVEKYFAPLPVGPPVPQLDIVTPPITTERRVVITDKVALPRVYMAWLTDPIFKPGDAEEVLLGRILGGRGKSSRLYQRLVYQKQIAQDVLAEQTSFSLGSVFTIEATAKPGIKPEQLEAAIEEELTAIQREGPTQAELDGARNVTEARLLRRLETIGGEGGVAGRLSLYNHHLGDPGFLPKDVERFNGVTARSVQLVAQQKLTNDSRVVVYCVAGPKVIQDVPRTTAEEQMARTNNPVESRTAFDATQSWRQQIPKAGPDPKISLPVPKRFQLANGLTVLLVERHDLPVITADLFFLGGSDANPADRPGLAAFTARMLEEGSKKRSGLQIAVDTDRLGAELVSTSTSDSSGISIRCLKETLDGAFDLISDMALHPAFAPAEVERLRQERLTDLLQEQDNPTRIALNVFYHLAYGSQHPYGYMELGSGDSIKVINRKDLLDFWARSYVPSNAVLAVTGDTTEAQLRSLAAKYLGSWQGASPSTRQIGIKGTLTRKIVIVDKPGSPQTALLVGGIGVPRSSPDYVPVEVMNNMLGGLVSARLNMNLREKHGYTYAVFSQFVYRRGPGPFFARTSVRTDVTGVALKELFSELDGINTRPLSTAELEASKNSMRRSLPGLFDTTLQTSKSISDLFVYGLPLDYYRGLPTQIEAVDSAAIGRASREHIQPDSMIVVAVGDRTKIEPDIRKLDLGPIEIRNRKGDVQTSELSSTQ